MYESRRIGVLSQMGVQPPEQGKLYWWQERSIMRQYQEEKEFIAKINGAKLR